MKILNNAFFSYERLRLNEFLGLSTFQFLADFRRSLFYGFVAIYLGRVMHLSTVEVTLMATVGMIANAGSQTLLWGNLLDRIKQSTSFVIIGEFVAGVGHILMYWWHKHALETGNLRYAGYTIIFSLGFIEIFWSQSNVGWSALISELTNDFERKKIMGQLSIIGGIGGIFGATVAGFVYLQGDGFKNGTLFYLPAIIMMISSVFVFFTIKIPKNQELAEPITDQNEITLISQKSAQQNLSPEVLSLFVIMIIALVFINFGRNSIVLIASLYIVDPGTFAATDLEVAMYRNVSNIAAMIAGLLLGSVLSKSNDHSVFTGGVIMAILAILWMIFAPSFYFVLIAAAIIGMTHVIIQASSYAIVASLIPPDYRGRLFAWYNATFFLSWGIGGTLIAAPIADFAISRGVSNADAYRLSFISAIILLIIGILIFIKYVQNARKLIRSD